LFFKEVKNFTLNHFLLKVKTIVRGPLKKGKILFWGCLAGRRAERQRSASRQRQRPPKRVFLFFNRKISNY